MVEEQRLLTQLQKKQQNSIDSAIECYTPYLSTVLYHMLGNSLPQEDIEEIIADVFISLWKNADHIDLSKGTLRSYLAAAARNFALKRLNKKRAYTSLDEIELSDAGSMADDRSERDSLWSAVMELGEPDSEIFVRYYKYDEKLKEISNATGLPLSTVKSKLARGKRKLKKILIHAEESL